MTNHKISTLSRLLILLSGLALIAVLFLPIWRIELDAPQYPEGLSLQIFAGKIAGDVEIINGLNHYIGMKTLHTEDFIEFSLLPGIILFFAALFVLVALLGKRKWMNGLLILFVLFGVVAMVDFWRWEYNYGHNLNPDAAIIVPGMAYQPPLIGFKQLLNFGAYSIPDTGGWIFIGAGALLLFVVIAEWRAAKKKIKLPDNAILGLLFLILIFTGCSTAPQPLQLGKDQCASCKMTISDERFGAEIVTTKSKLFKFDDGKCMLDFKKSGALDQKEIAAIYLSNYCAPYQLLVADKAILLQSDQLRSPMNGNFAAFENKDSMLFIQKNITGIELTWKELSK